jgi:hypothetical protein
MNVRYLGLQGRVAPDVLKRDVIIPNDRTFLLHFEYAAREFTPNPDVRQKDQGSIIGVKGAVIHIVKGLHRITPRVMMSTLSVQS